MSTQVSPVRLRELATAAGLSVSGVSRALNGDPTMASATRERVRKLAADLGYRANAAAQALRSASTDVPFRGTIAHIISPLEDAQMKSRAAREKFPWHFEVGDCASRHGYTVDLFVLEPGSSEGARLTKILHARGIRGVILSARHLDPREFTLDWKRFSAVSLSALPSAHFLNNLSVPYFQDTYDAIQRLLSLGYSRIGFLMVGNVLDAFFRGYEVALQSAGLPQFPVLKQTSEVPKSFPNWVRKHKLDAVLTTTGMEAVDAAVEAGFRIPADLGICVVDDIDAPGFLSGMRQPRMQLSRWAVDSLHKMLSHNEYGPPDEPVEIQFPSRWSEGKTVCKSRPKARK